MDTLNLRILTHSGLPYSVVVPKIATVKDLKIKVNIILGVKPEEQTILYNESTLSSDNSKLIDLGIEEESTLKLIVNFKKENFVLCVQMQDSRNFKVSVSSKDTLIDVKRKIQSHCNLATDEQILIYRGKVIEGNSLISEYGIEDNSVVDLLHRLKSGKKLQIIVTMSECSAYEVWSDGQIVDLKKKIEQKTGVPTRYQKLEYNGVILSENSTLKANDIVEGSTLTMIF